MINKVYFHFRSCIKIIGGVIWGLTIYNILTDMAISKNSYDSYIEYAVKYVVFQEKNSLFLDTESRNKLDKSLSLKETFFPLIEFAWRAVYDEYGQYRNCNMKYRKYISIRYELEDTLPRYKSECIHLEIEELVYLYLELTSEYIVDLSVSELGKKGLASREGYGYVDTYKENLANIIHVLREMIENKKNPTVYEATKRIRFNSDMFKAILKGGKTTTRRIAKFERRKEFPNVDLYASACSIDKYAYSDSTYCIYQIIGSCWNEMTYPLQSKYAIGDILYADDKDLPGSELADIHVIYLRITDVRIERLQDIRYHEVYQEGIKSVDICTDKCIEKVNCIDEQNAGRCHVIHAFKDLWNSTIKDSESDLYGWNADPYVFVYDFEVISKKEADKPLHADLESKTRK